MAQATPLLISRLELAVRELEASPPGFDPVELRAYHQRLRTARMRLARAKGRHTPEQWEAIVSETAGICVRCGYQHDLARERPVKAHVVPVAVGGTDAIDNLQPLCRRCMSAGPEPVNWLDEWREAQSR